MNTQVEEIHEKARRAIERAEGAAQGHLRDAAEYLAHAKELGATLTESAAAIGKSKPWVSLLLSWRQAKYSYPSPFHPPAKTKPRLSADKRPAMTLTRPAVNVKRSSNLEATRAKEARAQAVGQAFDVVWRSRYVESLTGDRQEFEDLYRTWAVKASPRDRAWAATLVQKVNLEEARRAA
jgi:hypothetical protein